MVNALLLNGRWQEALECVQNKSGELERMDYEEKIIDLSLIHILCAALQKI